MCHTYQKGFFYQFGESFTTALNFRLISGHAQLSCFSYDTQKYGKHNILILQILEGVSDCAQLLQNENEESSNSMCFFWVESPQVSVSKDELQIFFKFWEEEFLTDVTLLVGADKVSIKVHRVILAAYFEYFRSMFSTGLKESTSAEVCLPFVGPEDLRLLLRYAYSGEANLSKENVFKMVVMANYFGCKNLMYTCCDFLKHLQMFKTV